MKRFLRTLPMFALVLAAGACASPPVEKVDYRDGCDSGYERAGRLTHTGLYTRKEALYRTDEAYREAWDKGYEECFRDERTAPWVGGMGI